MQVAKWLSDIGLGECVSSFERNAIDWDVLPTLTPQDLTELGVTALGHRKKLAHAIAALRESQTAHPEDSAAFMGLSRLATFSSITTRNRAY